MTLHLIKLSVGSDSVETLAAWQAERRRQMATAGQPAVSRHLTRHRPKRADEIAGRGSIFWVIKGTILARQPITGFEPATAADGTPRCAIMLAPELVRVEARPCRAFQGWRYLEAADAPRDLDAYEAAAVDQLPAGMREELRALGLI